MTSKGTAPVGTNGGMQPGRAIDRVCEPIDHFTFYKFYVQAGLRIHVPVDQDVIRAIGENDIAEGAQG